MKTIFKESILKLMSQEISLAEMNCKRIAYFEVTESEWEDLNFELKRHCVYKGPGLKTLKCDAILYGIPVRIKGRNYE